MVLKCILFYIFIIFVNVKCEELLNNDLKEFRRICYYANWSPYRRIDPILYPDDIDPYLCTHIHYAFARIDPKTLELIPTEDHDMNWTEKSHMPLYIRLYSLKRRNPQLKTLLAVGGWSAKSTGFNEATRNQTNRTIFINQSIKFLREWNFDGIDLDWEFPGDIAREADVDSKENFDLLATEYRIAFDKEAEESKKKKLLLSSAVSADPKLISSGYNVSNLCKQLDYVSVMTYDYHGGSWDFETGLNSPLYGKDKKPGGDNINETSIQTWKNINYTINYWISNGCEPSKINLGLAAYGRSFTLKNSTVNKVGSPTIGKGGLPGIYTKEEGILSYFEICEDILSNNWTKHWDEDQQSVYATLYDQWVGYDNERSITLKVKWALSMSLGGTMQWTLDMDDYSGKFCNAGIFPIASTIKATYDASLPVSSVVNKNIDSTQTVIETTVSYKEELQQAAIVVAIGNNKNNNNTVSDSRQSNYSSYNIQLVANEIIEEKNSSTALDNNKLKKVTVVTSSNFQTLRNDAFKMRKLMFKSIFITIFIAFII